MSEIRIIGQMDNTKDHTFESANRVYGTDGIAPTIPTCAGGNIEPKVMEVKIVAMRGRDPQNPSDRTAGNPNLEQRLEPNSEGICNTLTTVQKDNMVLEMGYIEKGTGKHQSNVVYSEEGLAPTICASYGVKQPPAIHVEVKQATKECYIPCEIGGGGRPKLSRECYTQGKSPRKRTDMSNFDNEEYP